MTPEVFYLFYFLCLTSFSSLHLLNSFLFLFPFIFHTLFFRLLFASSSLFYFASSFSFLSFLPSPSLFHFLFLTICNLQPVSFSFFNTFALLFSLLLLFSPFLPFTSSNFYSYFYSHLIQFCSYSYSYLTHLIRHCAQSRHRRRRCRKSRNGQEGS